jgi:hypothetical protein
MTWQKMWASAETGWIIVEGIHCFFLFDDEGHPLLRKQWRWPRTWTWAN